MPDEFQEPTNDLAAAPAVELIGVVDPSGPHGVRAGDGPLTLLFNFVAWRIVGGEIQSRKLRIAKTVTTEQLTMFRAHIRPYDVLRLQARFIDDGSTDGCRAVLEKVIGPDKFEKTLLQIALQLQRPVVHTDPFFGPISLDRRFNWYVGLRDWCGSSIEINFKATNDEELSESLKTARLLWENQIDWNCKITEFAARKLLPLKNDSLLENESALSEQHFLDKLSLRSITIKPNGSFDFWFNNGDIFRGHAILIDGNLTEGPKLADTPG